MVDVPANQVVYLGSFEAVIVPRPPGSKAPGAGYVIPLIDQAVTGFSTGQWQLALVDRYDGDVATLKEKYPYLSGVEIKKQVIHLPAPKREPKTQRSIPST